MSKLLIIPSKIYHITLILLKTYLFRNRHDGHHVAATWHVVVVVGDGIVEGDVDYGGESGPNFGGCGAIVDDVEVNWLGRWRGRVANREYCYCKLKRYKK